MEKKKKPKKKKRKVNAYNIVREYFPDASDEEVDFILWEHTGYPCFFNSNDIEGSLREQLQALKNSKNKKMEE